jgi:hypothetical protein
MLPMPADPIFEWQRLTEHYRAMNDDELRELAADFTDLTDAAQQALRSEMRSRGLGSPEEVSAAPELRRAASNAPEVPLHDYAPQASSDSIIGRAALALGALRPELVPDEPEDGAEVDGPVEYTWKTLLCECDTLQEANELSEALKRAGIESWIEGPKASAYSAYASLDLVNPRVLVAADQLDQARAIAAQPIPLEIVKESEATVHEFTPPSCPNCGTPDPVLESVDPANSWKCEQCGQQ